MSLPLILKSLTYDAPRTVAVPATQMASAPAETYGAILRFLGAPPHSLDSYPRVYEQRYPELAAETRQRLAERFAEPNRRLYELLGRDFGWTAPQ